MIKDFCVAEPIDEMMAATKKPLFNKKENEMGSE